MHAHRPLPPYAGGLEAAVGDYNIGSWDIAKVGGVGGARRDRTADLNTASVALSQLSYGPGWCGFGYMGGIV